MAQVKVVIGTLGNLGQHRAEVPNDVPVRRLLPALVTRMGFPVIDPRGQPIKYQLVLGTGEERDRMLGLDETLAEVGVREGDSLRVYSDNEEEWKRLDPDETLAEVDVPDGDRIRVYSDTVAGCFPAGTPIALLNGTRIPIEGLKIGQQLLSFNPLTGAVCNSAVSAVTEQMTDHLLTINRSLQITRTHPVYSEGLWIPAGNLRIGDKLLCADGSSASISSLEAAHVFATVYNLHLDPPTHTFFAGEILVHNAYRKMSPLRDEPWGDQEAFIRAPSSLLFARKAPPVAKEEDQREQLDRSRDPGGLVLPEMARRAFAHHFLVSGDIREKFNTLFPGDLHQVSWRMRLMETRPAMAGDYTALFAALDGLYTSLLTVLRAEEFFRVWIKGWKPVVPPGEELLVQRIQKSSPLEIEGTGLGEVVKALGDTLSIGKQIEDIRKASIRVAEARLELKRKEFQLRAEERRADDVEALAELDLEIQREKKLLELEEIRERRRELERQHESLVRQHVDERFALLRNWIKILDELPDEFRAELKRALFIQVKAVYSSCFEVEELLLQDDGKTGFQERIASQ